MFRLTTVAELLRLGLDARLVGCWRLGRDHDARRGLCRVLRGFRVAGEYRKGGVRCRRGRVIVRLLSRRGLVRRGRGLLEVLYVLNMFG